MQPIRSTSLVESPVQQRPAAPLGYVVASCDCGHGKHAHEHYRRGSDCAFRDCARYRRPLLQRLGLVGR